MAAIPADSLVPIAILEDHTSVARNVPLSRRFRPVHEGSTASLCRANIKLDALPVQRGVPPQTWRLSISAVRVYPARPAPWPATGVFEPPRAHRQVRNV